MNMYMLYPYYLLTPTAYFSQPFSEFPGKVNKLYSKPCSLKGIGLSSPNFKCHFF